MTRAECKFRCYVRRTATTAPPPPPPPPPPGVNLCATVWRVHVCRRNTAGRVYFRLLMRRNFRRQRILRDRTNPFDIYDDVELFARFRFWLQDIVTLVDLFGDELEHPLPRGGSLPPLMQVLVALRFFASGAFQQTTGDLFNIDRRTVGRIIARFSSVLSEAW